MTLARSPPRTCQSKDREKRQRAVIRLLSRVDVRAWVPYRPIRVPENYPVNLGGVGNPNVGFLISANLAIKVDLHRSQRTLQRIVA